MLSTSVLTQVKARVLLSSIVRQAVELKGHGSKYLGLCPFHQEKTPSFNVSDKHGRFKCFGCGASGDVFEFIMRLRGLSFNEAARDVAQSVGLASLFESKKTKVSPGPDASKANQDFARELLRVQKAAHDFFISQIKTPLHKSAREYLAQNRFLNSAMIEQAALGFGGLSNEELFAFLKKNNISPKLASAAGLIKQQGSSWVSVFLRRIIFPIRRFDGKVVAFGGRSFLPEDQEAPKYLNTHAYMLYEKRTSFYGLFESKSAILKGQTPVIVEGYFDAMAWWALGVPALALCGTALSLEHVSILKRFVSRVIICFDKDQAGLRALRTSLALLWGKNMSASVVTLDKKDPGEYLSELPALKKHLEQQQDALCFTIDQARFRLKADIRGRISEIDQLMPIFTNIARPLIRRQYVAYLAQQLHEDPSILWAEISAKLKNKRAPDKTHEVSAPALSLNAEEKILAPIITNYPELISALTPKLKASLSPEFINFIACLDQELAIAELIKAESVQAALLSREEALEVLSALDRKIERLNTKNQIKQNRQELYEAEKAQDFPSILKSLKEQSLILAHNKRVAMVAPQVLSAPYIAKKHETPLANVAEYTEEDDWL